MATFVPGGERQIVLCSPKCSGKTTLVLNLAKAYVLDVGIIEEQRTVSSDPAAPLQIHMHQSFYHALQENSNIVFFRGDLTFLVRAVSMLHLPWQQEYAVATAFGTWLVWSEPKQAITIYQD
jgi:hypothetical protein